jgi:hypothetical protein
MKKGSLNSDLMQSHAVVNEGDFLGVVGNSGNSTEPHLHIDAVNMTTYRLRPLLFRDIQVLLVDTLATDPSSSWVHVNGQGLPATMSAIWPSATPIPSFPIQADISRWKAVAEIIFGIIGDGGDLIITPKGRRLPPPPPDPYRISSIKRDMLLGLALTEFALIASSNKSVKTIQGAGIDVMQEAIVKMKKLFESKSKEK